MKWLLTMGFQISLIFKRIRHWYKFHAIFLCFYFKMELNEAWNVEVEWITHWTSHPLMQLAYMKEHASISVREVFRRAPPLQLRQFFEFRYKNPYQCWGRNFIEFRKSWSLTQILVVGYSSWNGVSLWTFGFRSFSRETATETSSILSSCVSTTKWSWMKHKMR